MLISPCCCLRDPRVRGLCLGCYLAPAPQSVPPPAPPEVKVREYCHWDVNQGAFWEVKTGDTESEKLTRLLETGQARREKGEKYFPETLLFLSVS